VEVILIGEEPGLEQVAAEYGVKLRMNVERNEKGTPLVSSIFELAYQVSASPLLAYVNADILLLPDIVVAARQVSELVEKFLVVGQRLDLEVGELLDYTPGWEQRINADVKERGQLHLPAGSDSAGLVGSGWHPLHHGNPSMP
jgi:hypothetical protein